VNAFHPDLVDVGKRIYDGVRSRLVYLDMFKSLEKIDISKYVEKTIGKTQNRLL
jgi:hypothetical protein